MGKKSKMTDSELLKQANEFFATNSKSAVQIEGQIHKVFYLGCILLGDGRVIRNGEGGAYFDTGERKDEIQETYLNEAK